jgi:hypothetical protein
VLPDYILCDSLHNVRKINAQLESRASPSERLIPETTWRISITFGAALSTPKLSSKFA